MCLCKFFIDPAEAAYCSQGVHYGALAGGGAHYMVLRLPCIPISNRRGHEAQPCAKFSAEPETIPANTQLQLAI